MSSHNCCSHSGDGKPDPNDKSLSARLLRWASAVLPEGSALLSSSCCWLPTVLDLVFSGSVTAASVQKLRPVFLTISVLTLAWTIKREGLSRRNIVRAIICAALLAWTGYRQQIQPATGHDCCHH